MTEGGLAAKPKGLHGRAPRLSRPILPSKRVSAPRPPSVRGHPSLARDASAAPVDDAVEALQAFLQDGERDLPLAAGALGAPLVDLAGRFFSGHVRSLVFRGLECCVLLNFW